MFWLVSIIDDVTALLLVKNGSTVTAKLLIRFDARNELADSKTHENHVLH